MKLEHGDRVNLAELLRETVGRYLDWHDYKLFFFGSRVSGQSNERSDIDVGIEGPGPVPSTIWLDLKEAVDNLPTLYKIDLVDFARVSDDFKKIALAQSEPISI